MVLCPHTQVSLQWNGDSLRNQNSKGWSWTCSNSSYNLFLNLIRTPIPNPYRKTHLSSLKSTPPLDVWLDSAQLIMVGGSEAGLTPNHGCERLGDRAWVYILVFDKKVNHFAYNMVSFFYKRGAIFLMLPSVVEYFILLHTSRNASSMNVAPLPPFALT